MDPIYAFLLVFHWLTLMVLLMLSYILAESERKERGDKYIIAPYVSKPIIIYNKKVDFLLNKL